MQNMNANRKGEELTREIVKHSRLGSFQMTQ